MPNIDAPGFSPNPAQSSSNPYHDATYLSKAILDPPDQPTHQLNTTKVAFINTMEASWAPPKFLTHKIVWYNKIATVLSHYVLG